MKIALINENSQAAKNELIEATLKSVVEPMGHTVDNYGMYTAADEAQLTYVQVGILGAILLNSGAADYVITGCGTGIGAMLAMNSFPNVICGHVEDPVDAYTFAHVNDGNAVSIPFAKGFGWGGELNLGYIFEKLLLIYSPLSKNLQFQVMSVHIFFLNSYPSIINHSLVQPKNITY